MMCSQALSTIPVEVYCNDGLPYLTVNVEHDGIVSDVIQKVLEKKNITYIDCTTVEAFSGRSIIYKLRHLMRITVIVNVVQHCH